MVERSLVAFMILYYRVRVVVNNRVESTSSSLKVCKSWITNTAFIYKYTFNIKGGQTLKKRIESNSCRQILNNSDKDNDDNTYEV